ncbi:hypothetical protein J6590_052801 [Homalodisca vitripennis]|nr:hypothetical protein J6590_052801 [Homalodisca vitripennis]
MDPLYLAHCSATRGISSVPTIAMFPYNKSLPVSNLSVCQQHSLREMRISVEWTAFAVCSEPGTQILPFTETPPHKALHGLIRVTGPGLIPLTENLGYRYGIQCEYLYLHWIAYT